jgi:transposase
MIYIGMDISSKSFIVHGINEKKRVLVTGEIAPTRAGLKGLIKGLGVQKKLVIFEAGNQLKWIAKTLQEMEGVEIHVVHPNEIKWINQSSGKTDKIDARKLAHLGRGDMLPRKVHIVEGKIRELRELISARQQLQSKRVALINSIRGQMKQEGHSLPEKFFQSTQWREKLKGIKIGEVQKLIIGSFMESIDSLLMAEKKLTEKIGAIRDKRIELLESIPSLGRLSSRVILSAVDDVGRFDSKKCVAKYGALTPRIYQSGSITHLGGINRDGRQEVRRVLLQCAHVVARMRSYGARPLREFFERIRKRRGKKIAIVAVARKLLTIAYGVLKSKTAYDPLRLTGVSA